MDALAPNDHRVVERICRHLQGALGAEAVAVWTEAPWRVMAASGHPLPHPGARGVDSTPILYGLDPVAQLAWSRASAAPPVNLDLVAAAADIAAPLLASCLTLSAEAPADAPYGLVGVSLAMTRLRAFIPKVAGVLVPVLVEGESGVGKELVARAVHAAGPRRQGGFVAVNCAALSDELVDAELFGHAKGAFTGAALDRRGLIEDAHGGTLFLDEVAELSPRAQAKLLRVLQEGEVRRVGENAPRRVDVRVVSATNRPLRDEAAAGRFRHDLRFRLDVVRLVVPPLRERREDIPLLAEHFWRQMMQGLRRSARLAPSLMAVIAAHDWPGNARELQNVMAAIAAAGPSRGLIVADDVRAVWHDAPAARGTTLDQARRVFEAAYVRAAFDRCGQRPSAVARELGVTRQGLAKLVVRLGLGPTGQGGPMTR
ncbi:MAG: sigma-54 dependent transcriptional regulator, partial [Acidobacteriota bacterium]